MRRRSDEEEEDQTRPWWCHQVETFFAVLAIWAGNSLVTGKLPEQRPMTQSFDVFFDLRLNKQLSKQWWGWWFGMPLCPLWCHCNDYKVWMCPSTYSFVMCWHTFKFSSLQKLWNTCQRAWQCANAQMICIKISIIVIFFCMNLTLWWTEVCLKTQCFLLFPIIAWYCYNVSNWKAVSLDNKDTFVYHMQLIPWIPMTSWNKGEDIISHLDGETANAYWYLHIAI